MQIRQGDILLVRTNDQPSGNEVFSVPSGVIATGEATGHAHRVVDGSVKVDGEAMYVIAGSSTSLAHDEHEVITIPEGTYRVRRQREEGDDGATHYVAD